MRVISGKSGNLLQQEPEPKDGKKKIEVRETTGEKKRQDMQQKIKDRNQNSKEEALNSGGDVHQQAETHFQPAVQNQPIEITQPTMPAGDTSYGAQQQPLPAETVDTTENISIEENNPEQSQPVVNSTSYQGKILTGREVARIAAEEEARGIFLYLKTREAGEGFFSADAIAQMIDNTCSYLAQGITDGQLTFIQQ